MDILQGRAEEDSSGALEQPAWIIEQRFRVELRIRFKQYLELGKTLLVNSMLSPDTVTSLKRIQSQNLANLSQIPNSEKYHINRYVNSVPANERTNFESQCIRETAQMLTRLAQRYAEIGEKLDGYEIDANNAKSFDQNLLPEYVNAVEVIGKLKSLVNKNKENHVPTVRFVKFKLRETYETFIAEKSRQTKPDTIAQYKNSFKFFFSVLGEDFDILKIDKKIAVDIKNQVLKLKSNASKGCDDKLLAVKTANRYLVNFSTFMKWARQHCGYEAASPFEGLLLNEKHGEKTKRRRFSDAEVLRMLGYQTRDKREATGLGNCIRWYVAIGAFSGMRLNEISQLRLSDIRVTDGIYHFDLMDGHLKTKHSQRLIPIHSKLIANGFLEYVREREIAGDIYLFQELYNRERISERHGAGEPVSRWFNRTLLRNIGIDKNAEINSRYLVDFHCLRKTVISIWKNLGVSGYIVRQLVGHHREEDITFDSCYGEGELTNLRVLQSVIELIDYATPAPIEPM